MIALIALLTSTGCLKPNPLAEIDLAGEDEIATEPPTDALRCMAPPEYEPECGACLVEHCCTSLVVCGVDPICVCEADCLFAGGQEGDCRSQCGKPPDALAPLLSCAMQDCASCYGP